MCIDVQFYFQVILTMALQASQRLLTSPFSQRHVKTKVSIFDEHIFLHMVCKNLL